MINSVSKLYVHTVQVSTLTGHPDDGSGATWSAPTSIPCLIAEESKLLRQPDGTEVTSSTQIYAGPTPLLREGARVVLPAAPHRPGGLTTYVIGTTAVVVGDPAIDGMTAMCE